MNRWLKRALTVTSAGVLATSGLLPNALAGPAAFTSDDISMDGAGHCLHGNPDINCNDYDGKQYVWLNGGPLSAQLANGSYFFAVVASGGQSDPNDPQSTNPNLLSSDPYQNRSFTVSGCPDACTFTFIGSGHDVDGTKVRLVPYDGTLHVYHLMICALDDQGNQPDSKSCKSDAFKVEEGSGGGGGFSAPRADKTAVATHNRSVKWSITKTADPTVIHSGTPVTTNYTVTATKTISNERWGVHGTITVTNTNADPLTVTGIVENLPTDEPSLGATCSVAPSGGGSYTFPVDVPAQSGSTPGTLDFDYSCTLNPDPTPPDYTATYLNSATVSYTDPGPPASTQTVDAVQTFNIPASATLDAGSDPESVTVSDTNSAPTGSPGTGTVISDTTVFHYSITFFNNFCQDYPNTATLSTGPSASATVTFCGPNTGGLTQGFWQNKNGQTLLKNNTTAACNNLNGYVTLAPGFTGSSDLINVDSGGDAAKTYVSTECTDSTKFSYLPKFDLFVFNLANSSGSGLSMLLSQWLTTVLDTGTYTTGKAGGPGLSGSTKIYNPDHLLGQPVCTTIGNMLTHAVTDFGTYKADKATVTALSSFFDKINNNQQPTC